MNYIIIVLVDLRKCASSARINDVLTFVKKIHALFKPDTFTITRKPITALLHTCGLEHVPVANAVWP